jgi:hypothetical protein
MKGKMSCFAKKLISFTQYHHQRKRLFEISMVMIISRDYLEWL